MTETTQPDPQVVAWMREYLRVRPGVSQYAAVLAGTNAFGDVSSVGLADAYQVAREPLTVADIPAGLFLKDDGRGYVDLYEKGADGGVAKILDLDEVSATLAQHLAATLPTVTAEEDAP